jgi:hypothetical protein
MPLCTRIQTLIKVLYIQSLVICPYVDTSRSSDIAIYHAIKVIKVQATTYLPIKDGSIN